MIPAGQLANAVVRAMVEAINAGERDAFFARSAGPARVRPDVDRLLIVVVDDFLIFENPDLFQ
jgi:hypothetical protein